ncbi:hypothetical protein ACIBFB_14675 [Nocardiopsis sp. NPDC050513]|uniref:hypothetical protein n=1 Tax=Nocardiopsis sp. NPDC050513 TaxID=3364338 RepID=UPI0037B8ECE5
MKFDVVPFDHGEESPRPAPGSTVSGEGADGGTPALAPDARLRRAFAHLRTRSGTDLARVRSALNRMHHTVEAARAQDSPDDTGTADLPPPPGFRPEAFGARTSD